MNLDNIRRFVAALDAVFDGERGPASLGLLGPEVFRDVDALCRQALAERPVKTCPACGSCTVPACLLTRSDGANCA